MEENKNEINMAVFFLTNFLQRRGVMDPIRHFHKHTELAIMEIMEIMEISYSHIFAVSFIFLHHKMLVNVKLMPVSVRGLYFRVADFIGLVNIEWYSQNKVGNIRILV